MKILSQMSFQKHSVNEQNPANQLMLTPIPVPYHSSLSGVWTIPIAFVGFCSSTVTHVAKGRAGITERWLGDLWQKRRYGIGTGDLVLKNVPPGFSGNNSDRLWIIIYIVSGGFLCLGGVRGPTQRNLQYWKSSLSCKDPTFFWMNGTSKDFQFANQSPISCWFCSQSSYTMFFPENTMGFLS